MQSSVSCEDILGRLSILLQTKTDAELGIKLGVAAQTVSTWRGRNRIPYEQLVELSIKTNTTLDYLVFGDSPGAISTKKNVDLKVFKEAINAVKSEESELKNMPLEHVIDYVIDIYNSVIQCESEAEKDRMVRAQIQMLNKFLAPVIIGNLESLKPHVLDTKQAKNLRSDIDKYEKSANSSENTTVKQGISGKNHQVAGRDVINRGKK